MTDTELRIATYICEEVRRQGHDLAVGDDGGVRVRGMWRAWEYAIEHQDRAPKIGDILQMGALIEACNASGWRTCGVRVGMKICPPPAEVPYMMTAFIEDTSWPDDIWVAYRHFLDVHPFQDGNGRTAKCLLAWWAHSLDAPFFPPRGFWGREIQNP